MGRWMVGDKKYAKYNTTRSVAGRLKDTFNASKVSRRLVMFQVWFVRNTSSETLQGYNERLGRPQTKVRNGVVAKTKFILNSQSWRDYFNELDVVIRDDKAIDQLLRFAIFNSKSAGYHRDQGIIKKVNPPSIRVNGYVKQGHVPIEEGVSMRSSGRGIRGSGWRGRGRGTVNIQRGRGRGFQSNSTPNGQNAQMNNGQTPIYHQPQMQQPGMRPIRPFPSNIPNQQQPGMRLNNKN